MEMEVAVRVVQVACSLCQRVQDSLVLSDSGSSRIHSKLDRSPVTVADWGVQAIVSWLLSDCFHDGSVSIVAKEDDQTLSSSDGAALLESVVAAVTLTWTLWLTGIAGSITYNWSRPGMKASVKIIHARYLLFREHDILDTLVD